MLRVEKNDVNGMSGCGTSSSSAPPASRWQATHNFF